jgi:hypothetical protein
MTGGRLAREYYENVVGPLVDTRWPGVTRAAGRLGSGSDVLGYDDDMSRDHDWGLRLTLLVDAEIAPAVDAHLEAHLPDSFRGHPTRFATTWRPEPHHQVEVGDPDGFVVSRLGIAPPGDDDLVGWLTLTGQSVLEITAGDLFLETDGRISAARDRLAWYPDDLWRYVIAADWSRIGQELPFVGRTAVIGDDLGSRVIAARIVRSAMHLGFLLERAWPPYPKWSGTAFARLPRVSVAAGHLTRAMHAEVWDERESALIEALEVLLTTQRSLGFDGPEHATEQFYDRPFRGLSAIPEAVMGAVNSPAVSRLPHGVGSIEQWVDNVDVLIDPAKRVGAARSFNERLLTSE